MTPEEQQALLEQEALNYLYSTNEYGSGSGFLGAKGDPWKQMGYREDVISDLFRMSGIYPEDLLNLPGAPEKPGDMPVYQPAYQSDLRGVYATNPLVAEMFRDIEAGADPSSAATAALARFQANPSQYQGAIPGRVQYQNEYGMQLDTPEIVSDAAAAQQFLPDLAQSFATDVSKEKRENSEAMAAYELARQKYDQQAEEYFRYNNPTSGLYDLGDPTFEQFAKMTGVSKALGQVPTKVTYDRAGSEAAGRRLDAADKLAGIAAAVPDWVSGNSAKSGLAAIGRPLSQNSEAGQTPKRIPERKVEMGAATGATKAYQDYVKQGQKKQYEKLKNSVRPSGREMENRRRAAMAMALMFGQQ